MDYYKIIHYLTQEIANYSVEEVNSMAPFEVELFLLLKQEQLEREEEALRKAKAEHQYG